MSAHLPDIVLERYRLNELPRSEAERVTALIRQDPQLRARLDALVCSDAEMTRDGSLERLRGQPGARAAASPGGSRRRAVYWALPAVAALATVAMVFFARPPSPRADGDAAATPTGAGPAPDSGARIKGLRPTLALYRRTADGSETLADGAVAHAGDLVRVAYHPAGKPYGVIFSIDGRGAITMHLPPAGDRAVPLAREATALLDQAYELDDAPHWERFYFITADAPFEVAPIVDAARRASAVHPAAPAALALPRGLEQSTFSLQKEARP
jgi:hypothetical protein